MKPTPIDFAIITTLDIEFDAVCGHLENPQRIDQSKDAVVYFRGKVQIPHTSAAYDVVVCQILQMGNVESALATENLLVHWEPQAIILVGIAGGREGKVNLGDIVISKKVVYYERGKLLDDSTQYRPEEYPVHPFLWNKAKFYSDTAWHNRIGVPPPCNHDRLPNLPLGTIASVEHVVDSATLMATLASEVNDLSAVAM